MRACGRRRLGADRRGGSASGRGARPARRPDGLLREAGLDRGEPLDQPLQRLVHGFERFLRALVAFGLVRVQRLEIAPEALTSPPAAAGRPRRRARRARRSRPPPRAPRAPDGQLLDAALDRAELAEPLVRGLDLVGEPHDAPFDLLEGGLIAAARSRRRLSLSVSDLTSDLDVARQRADLLDAGVERVGQLVDALRQRIEAARAGDRAR